MILNQKIDSLMMIVGRVLLGIYFLLPGLGKILTYSDNIILLTSKGVPLTPIALPLTILIEVILGAMLIFDRYIKMSSMILFALTLLINIFIHDFWNLSGVMQSHEAQNFYFIFVVAVVFLIFSFSV